VSGTFFCFFFRTVTVAHIIVVMPRPKRIAFGGYVYHVLNRANGRLRIFHTENDFLASLALPTTVEGMYDCTID